MPKSTHAQKDAQIAKLREQIARLDETILHLEDQLAAMAAAPAPVTPPAPDALDGFEAIGSVSLDGVLLLTNTAFPESWSKAKTTQSAIAIDFVGDNAEKLARMHAPHPVSQLSDGTWRVTVPSQDFASVVEAQSIRRARQSDWKCAITMLPIRASRLRALDATRGTGHGTSDGAICVRASQANVYAQSEDGHVKALHIKL
jgi:hypothetical protein